jgi:hypothetical protein
LEEILSFQNGFPSNSAEEEVFFYLVLYVYVVRKFNRGITTIVSESTKAFSKCLPVCKIVLEKNLIKRKINTFHQGCS